MPPCNCLSVPTVGDELAFLLYTFRERQLTYYLAISECDLDKVIMGLTLRIALAEYLGV